MKPNTAIAFIAAGFSLLLKSPGPIARQKPITRALATVLAAGTALVGAATASEYLLHVNLGLDDLIFHKILIATGVPHPGRMAFSTALAFTLLGGSLLALDSKVGGRFRLSEWLALLATLLAFVSLLGYVFGARVLREVLPFSTIAVHTAALLLLLGVSVLFSRQDHGTVVLITSHEIGGIFVRRLLPAAIVLPVVIGWLLEQGHRKGLYGTEIGLALMIGIQAVALVAVLAVSGLWLNLVDIARRRADQNLRDATEVALRRSRDELRKILDSLATFVGLLSTDGILLEVNQPPLDMAALRREDVIGKALEETHWFSHSAEARDRMRVALERARQGGTVRYDEVLRAGGDQRVTVDVILSPVRDASGKVVQIVGSGVDITQRKEAEAALRLSEERLRLAAESSQTGMWDWDFRSGEVYLSPVWKRQLGYADHELPNRYEEWQSRVHPDDLPQMKAKFEALVQDPGMNFETEYRLHHRDGSYRWILSRVTALTDGQGRTTRTLGSHVDLTKRKETESAIRNSEELLQLFIEHAPAALAMFDRDMRYIRVSRRWRTDYAFGDRNLIGASHYEVFPDIPEHWKEAHRRGLRGEVLEGHDPFERSDGSMQWIRWEIRPWHNRMGEIGGIVIFSEDTTERRRAEEALRKSEAELREAQRISRMGSSYRDLKAETITFSEQLFRILGLNPISGPIPIGQAEGLFSPEVRRLLPETTASSGEPAELEVEFRRADGTSAWVFLYREAARDEAGNVVGVRGIAHDITERKRAEAALSESEARLRTALEAAGMVTFERDLRTGEAHWMPGTEVMFGFEPGTGPASIEDFLRLVHPEDREHFDHLMAESIETGVAGGEWRVNWPDGSIHWIYGRWMVLKDDQGQPLRAIGVDYDITARKQAEESLRMHSEQLRALTIRLQQVREEERRMVARDLHDQIGQILTAVRMDVDWVAKHISPQDEARVSSRLAATLDRVRDATQSLRSICTRLRPGVLDDLGLAAAIEWQVKEFASITGIQCHVSVPQEDLPVDADRSTAIFRILQEALTNVARHAQARMVRATLAQQNGNLVLVVQDDGKGISESDVESSRGSLGLLGMKERAEACGGELEIWGDPGKGTTLALHIPLAEPRQQGGNDADPAGR